MILSRNFSTNFRIPPLSSCNCILSSVFLQLTETKRKVVELVSSELSRPGLKAQKEASAELEVKRDFRM
jgi:hypothetical protein